MKNSLRIARIEVGGMWYGNTSNPCGDRYVMSLDCTNVNITAAKLYHSFARGDPGRDWVKRTQDLCISYKFK